MDFSSLNQQCIAAFGQTVTYQPAAGDEATIDGAAFKVFQVLSDPTGGAWLSIREYA
jgi:hypothetical protein